MLINWKIGRWITIFVAAWTFLLLAFGAIPLIGLALEDELMGFTVKTLTAVANLIAVYILYKVL